MSKKKAAGMTSTNGPTEKRQLTLAGYADSIQNGNTTPQEKQTRFDKLVACRCAVLGFDEAERYLELETRASPFNDLPGLNPKERDEYYQLRELATVRLISQRRKYNGK